MYDMEKWKLESKASEEAQRLYEKEFSFHNPYTVIICDGIPFSQREEFYRLVEEELNSRDEKIIRPYNQQYFKIVRYQK